MAASIDHFRPMLFGVFLNTILYGVFIMQTYIYFLTYKKDKMWMKLFIFYLFIGESANVAFDIHIIYEVFVQNYNNPQALQYFPASFFTNPASIAAVSAPIQLFLAWRVLLLTKSKILSALITALALVSLAAGIWLACGVAEVKLFTRATELRTQGLLWLLTSAACDILITVSLVVTLNKKKTGFVTTDDVLSKIIRMTVQTGLLTTVFALTDVLFFMILPGTGLNFAFDMPLAKFYSNCLLSTLNARASFHSSISIGDASGRKELNLPGSRRNDTGFQMDPIDPVKRPVTTHNVEFSGDQHFIHTYDPEEGKYHERSQDTEYGVKVTKVIETTH